jgi:hypothetical protein
LPSLYQDDYGGASMSKLYTIDELVQEIYEDNLNHFEFHENMGGEDCDCHIHTTIKTIVKYWEK